VSTRVIAGSARGRRLKLVPGDGTRPISDRVKENLFNILGKDVLDSSWLDLYAGTGAVGIEALSRGAQSVWFNDLDRRAIATIRSNLETTGYLEQARVTRRKAEDVLARAPQAGFDFIYIAPPQYKGMWLDSLRQVDSELAWLSDEAIVVAQIDPRERADEALQHLVRFDQRRYGNTLLNFYQVE
jgi:16S rRNA (guanine(966)-N(2))-methyltransferase RsmD